MALTALDGSLAHRLMAPFAGLVSPVLAKTGDLATLFRLVAGSASLFLLDLHMLFVREADIAILGGEADGVTTEGSSGTEHDEGNAENETFHFLSPF